MTNVRTCILLSLFFALGCEKATAPETPLPLPLTDRIVFESDRADPLGDIYAMTFDGGDVRRLTRSAAGETCPSISPDGNWIAYYSHIDADHYTLWLMRANGADPRVITDSWIPAHCAIWSRTSEAILATAVILDYAQVATRTQNQVFDLAGRELARFENYASTLTAFSADGTELVGQWSNCSSNGCGQPDIAVIKIDGSGHRWLTGAVGPGTFQAEGAMDPSLAPDGATVAYICKDSVDVSLNSLCTVQWDGTGKTRIAETGWASPRFSPNGMRVSFLCRQGGSSDLCAIDVGSTNVLRWPVDASRDGADWTPDGSHLVFECGGKDICSIQPDVGALINLTHGQGTNANPSMARIVSQ